MQNYMNRPVQTDAFYVNDVSDCKYSDPVAGQEHYLYVPTLFTEIELQVYKDNNILGAI